MLYPIAAIRLLLVRGMKGLFGFALLFPWLMFATELATVRVQESFVIYRSYLWMAGLFAAMPFLFQKLPAKRGAAFLTVIALVMLPMTWDRLTSFSQPFLLWNDAARLVETKGDRPGMERIYHNRGGALADEKHYQQAIEDYNKAIAIYPEYSFAYYNRGAAYLEMENYPQALHDFAKAIELEPRYYKSYLGRGLAYEELGNLVAARRDYERSCLRGSARACQKFHDLSPNIK